MCNIIKRIQAISTHEGITIGALEKKIGASKGVLSRAINNGTDIQSKWLESLVENYPNINTDWLLSGQGHMLKQVVTQNTPKAIHTTSPVDGIPLIPIEAMAGAFTTEKTILEYECERYIVPMFKGADFLIPVKGSSMYPKYSSGDVVACQRVPMTDLFFQWNKVYVIDTTQGALIKRIKPGSDKDKVLIVSDNEKYDPFELPISSINAVALVIGVIRLE
jgi:repressor LexA